MFRDVIGEHVERYSNCIFATDRAAVVQSVIDKIASFGGRFLKKSHENESVSYSMSILMVYSQPTIFSNG